VKQLQDEKAEIAKVASEEKQEIESIETKETIDEVLAGIASSWLELPLSVTPCDRFSAGKRHWEPRHKPHLWDFLLLQRGLLPFAPPKAELQKNRLSRFIRAHCFAKTKKERQVFLSFCGRVDKRISTGRSIQPEIHL
jgi:hypothetical protein